MPFIKKNIFLLLICSGFLNTLMPVPYGPYLQFHAVNFSEPVVSESTKLSNLDPLNENQCRSIAVNLIEKSGYIYSNAHQVDEMFIQKTELPQLIAINTQPHTMLGEVSLYTIMAQPLTVLDPLMQRQAIVHELSTNDELLEQLNDSLHSMKELEPYALHYFAPKNQMIEQITNKVYFPPALSRLNKSPLALGVRTRLQNAGFALTLFTLPINLFVILNNIKYAFVYDVSLTTRLKDFFKLFGFWNYKRGNQSYKEFLNDFFKSKSKSGVQISNAFPQNSVELVTFFGALPQEVKDAIWKEMSAKAVLIGGGSIGLLAALYGYAVYTSYNDQKLLYDIMIYLQTRLIALRSYIDNVEAMYNLLKKNPELQELASIKNLEIFFDKERQSSSLKQVLNLLKSRTFEGEASFFSLSGKILAAHKIVQDAYGELQPLFIASGELDAFISVAHLYKKHIERAATFSFVSFIKSNQPYIEAAQFWNPQLNPSEVVTNDIVIGGDNQKDLIITGPNTAGKTTLLKGLLDSIVYAQTFGIAPATKFVFTPFHILNCYLNITDNLKEGTSLFKAEVLRAKKLINDINSLTKDQFAFTIIDELFSGTSPEEGAYAAVKFATMLAQLPQSICLFATHFKELTELEQNLTTVANYHVPLIKQVDGTFYRPFKLERGINKLNVALDLLKMEGVF